MDTCTLHSFFFPCHAEERQAMYRCAGRAAGNKKRLNVFTLHHLSLAVEAASCSHHAVWNKSLCTLHATTCLACKAGARRRGPASCGVEGRCTLLCCTVWFVNCEAGARRWVCDHHCEGELSLICVNFGGRVEPLRLHSTRGRRAVVNAPPTPRAGINIELRVNKSWAARAGHQAELSQQLCMA
jgi:hypothetical protein